MLRQLFLYAVPICFAVLMAACAAPAKHQHEEVTAQVEVGLPNCIGCGGVKLFTSQTLANELYAVRDTRDVRTGERISASLGLGISNRQSWLMEGATAPSGNSLFENEVQTDRNHPYRFLLRIHHNSSFSNQDVYLVTTENEYFPLPPVKIEGVENKPNCFRSGCVWDSDYVLPAKVVNDLLARRSPLVIFVGNRVPKQVQSKDGLNASYETVNAGVLLRVPPEKLGDFVTNVRRQLGLRAGT